LAEKTKELEMKYASEIEELKKNSRTSEQDGMKGTVVYNFVCLLHLCIYSILLISEASLNLVLKEMQTVQCKLMTTEAESIILLFPSYFFFLF
jgi:hypothetical protein